MRCSHEILLETEEGRGEPSSHPENPCSVKGCCQSPGFEACLLRKGVRPVMAGKGREAEDDDCIMEGLGPICEQVMWTLDAFSKSLT